MLNWSCWEHHSLHRNYFNSPNVRLWDKTVNMLRLVQRRDTLENLDGMQVFISCPLSTETYFSYLVLGYLVRLFQKASELWCFLPLKATAGVSAGQNSGSQTWASSKLCAGAPLRLGPVGLFFRLVPFHILYNKTTILSRELSRVPWVVLANYQTRGGNENCPPFVASWSEVQYGWYLKWGRSCWGPCLYLVGTEWCCSPPSWCWNSQFSAVGGPVHTLTGRARPTSLLVSYVLDTLMSV